MEPEHEDVMKAEGPPLDYSFKEIRSMSDVARSTPREGPRPYVTTSVKIPEDESVPNTTKEDKKNETDSQDDDSKQYLKYHSKAIRLSNNSLSAFNGFSTALQAVINLPDILEWIDLSFNDFSKISDALLEYKNLRVLYLHANYIEDLKELDKLSALPHLKTLTLHGNMIDAKKGYRQYVINQIPHLQYLDFSRITKADREKAFTWKNLKLIENQSKTKKKKNIEEKEK